MLPNQTGSSPEVVTSSQVTSVWWWVAGFMIVGGALFGSRPVFGLGLLLGAALGVAWVWARWCLRDLRVERHFGQTRAFWGEEVDMSQVFTNAKALPVPWLAVDDHFPGGLELVSGGAAPSHKARTRQVSTALSVGWYERVSRHYTLKC